VDGHPNPLAWLALLLVGPLAFLAFRKWRPQRAALTVVFGGAMFLPCVIRFNFPVIPDFDKEILPSFCALLACWLLRRQSLRGARPFRGPEGLVAVAALAVFGTVFTNTDPIVHGPTVLPGETLYDGLVDGIQILATWFPPFYLGRALFRSSKDLHALMRFLVLAGLVYSVFIFIELRMSPQLHNWVYGFHQSDFIQTIRFGGYRPKVFMRHGLNVALFMTMTVASAAALWKAKAPVGRFWTPGRAFLFLVVVLVLCKSTGAYFHAAIVLPVLLFFGMRMHRLAAGSLATLILGYPLFRSLDWIPVDAIVEWMRVNVNEERALSLGFRLFTEEEVLANARERIWFGWGGYGRPFEFDETTGQMISVLDGYWTIELSTHGVVGWLCIFGMMLWPVLVAVWQLPKIESRRDRTLVGALAILSALYVFDWLPNSSISADLTFMVGALAGVVPGILAEQRAEREALRQERAEENRKRRGLRSEPRGQGPLNPVPVGPVSPAASVPEVFPSHGASSAASLRPRS
jgi:hypothetical protein